MRILILNTSDNAGGAAVAARRLMCALCECGHDARMLVRDKTTDDARVTAVQGRQWSKAVDRARIFVANGFTRDKLWLTDAGFCGCGVADHPLVQWAEVIHLHWVGQGFMSLGDIERVVCSGKRVVWTLHDLWPLMGVCHLPDDCVRYESGCRDCPQLCRPSSHDLAAATFERKRRILAAACNLTFVGVSTWAAGMASRSALLQGRRVCVVPNVIDTSVAVRPVPKQYTIVFGAARIDHRVKGFRYLAEALHHLVHEDPELTSRLRLVTFGDNRDPHLFDHLPVTHTHLGVIDETTLAGIYDRASVVVSSSLYETFGQTLTEGALHRCVPVAFAGSGPDDIIDHQRTGWLARHLDARDLARGIREALAHQAEWGEAARKKVLDSYSASTVVERYLEVYRF